MCICALPVGDRLLTEHTCRPPEIAKELYKRSQTFSFLSIGIMIFEHYPGPYQDQIYHYFYFNADLFNKIAPSVSSINVSKKGVNVF